MKTDQNRKPVIRLLKILIKNPGCPFERDRSKNCVVLSTIDGDKKTPVSIFQSSISNGLIVVKDGFLKITSTGVSYLKRQLCDHDPFANQHRIPTRRTVTVNDIKQSVTLNCAESPLARLYSRTLKNGFKYISMSEFEAGERLRRDFEKAGLQPSITSHWGGGASSQNKSSATNMAHDLNDAAIDAKSRFEKAMNAVGPELTGVTLDICCFLKGFEGVERERGWPSRSAKLMLKTALSRLARHYGYCAPVVYRSLDSSGEIGSWGAPDYRPTM